MDEIILIDPTKKWVGAVGVPYPPLAILSVGGYLEKNGIKVKIIDVKFDGYKKMNLHDATCVGITAMTGRQIHHGLEIAKFIREKDPDIPIIWGGIHPTLLPEQTLENEYVDIVVRNEGEHTAMELVQKISNGDSLETIKGISYKEGRKIINNTQRPFMNMDEIYDIPYHLLKNFKKYHPKDVIHYLSSRGCPHRCKFCYNLAFSKRCWRSKSTKKILDELTWIIEKFHPKSIDFIEDNFFVDKNRVKEICNGLIELGFDGKWSGDCRINYFKNFDSSFMKLLKKSGCDGLFLGVESGSQRILDFIQKDIKVDEVIPAIKKCKEYDIGVLAAFMVGFPTETIEDSYETINLVDKIHDVDENALTLLSVLSPYPGTEMYDIAIKYGFEPPKSLEEWGGNWNFSNVKNIPWCNHDHKIFLQTITNISRVMNKNFSISRHSASAFFSSLVKSMFVFSANTRWKYKFFDFPIEWKLWTFIQKWRGYA